MEGGLRLASGVGGTYEGQILRVLVLPRTVTTAITTNAVTPYRARSRCSAHGLTYGRGVDRFVYLLYNDWMKPLSWSWSTNEVSSITLTSTASLSRPVLRYSLTISCIPALVGEGRRGNMLT